jgi:hypothetical protein
MWLIKVSFALAIVVCVAARICVVFVCLRTHAFYAVITPKTESAGLKSTHDEISYQTCFVCEFAC